MFYLKIALIAPGVMLHEMGHHLFCLLTGVRVQKVVYFRLGNPAGFVIHEVPEFYRQILAIAAGPIFVNSTVSVVMLNMAMREGARAQDVAGFGLTAVMVWLGLSAALQAVPSRADAVNVFKSSNSHLLRGNPVALLGYPVALVVYVVQVAKPLGSEWYYALLMGYLALQGFVGTS